MQIRFYMRPPGVRRALWGITGLSPTRYHLNLAPAYEPPVGTAIALIHSELSEALEEEHNGNPDIWFACNESDNFICTPQDETECLMYGKESLCKYRSRKPEGVAVELADAVIRIADLCGHLGIDLEEVIEIKMAYNEGRPYKHGKKF